MKLTIRAIALCSILACATETALADCKNLKFGTLPLTVFWQGGSGPYAGKYNPFNPIAYAQQVEFSVTKNSGECDFFVAFDISAHSGDFNRQLDRQDNRLAYNLYKEASLSTVLKDSNSDAQSVISGHLTAIQNSVQLSYFFNIEPEQLSDNGHFRDSVTIELHPNTFYANSPSTVSKKWILMPLFQIWWMLVSSIAAIYLWRVNAIAQ
jgi:spore coat protein U-like protein